MSKFPSRIFLSLSLACWLCGYAYQPVAASIQCWSWLFIDPQGEGTVKLEGHVTFDGTQTIPKSIELVERPHDHEYFGVLKNVESEGKNGALRGFIRKDPDDFDTPLKGRWRSFSQGSYNYDTF